MTYTITSDTLPQFLAQISYLIRVDGKVICDIKNSLSKDDFLVDQRRATENNPRETVRQEIEQHPKRFSHLITK
jgi:hypothetical protein